MPFLVITRPVAERHVVVAVSDSAAGRGIRPEMTLAQARALCATVEHEPHDPAADAAALLALARWMLRFSPGVYLPLEAAPEHGGEGLWIDLTGTDRLHGRPDSVAAAVASALHRWQVTARLALGPTPAAAWAGTFDEGRHGGTGGRHEGTEARRHEGEEEPVSPTSCLRASALPCLSSPPLSSPTPCLRAFVPSCLSSLPIPALRLPADMVAALHHLGIRTIGQLARLPRDELPARFGPTLLRRLDQLFGRVEEPLRLVQPTAPVVAARRWEEPVENLELIWPVAAELIDKIAAQLLRRGHGAREVAATLRLAQGPPLERTIRLSRPSRDEKKLLDLLRRAVEGRGGRDEETERRRDEETKRRRDGVGRSDGVRNDGGADIPVCHGVPRRPSREVAADDSLGRKPQERDGGSDGEMKRRRDGVGRGSGLGCRWATPRLRTSSLRLSVSSSLRSRSPSLRLPPDLSHFDYNGYVGIRLEVTRWQPIAAEQVTLDGGAAFEADVEMDDLVERLRVRLSPAAVAQARPVESYLPERAWTLLDPDEDAAPAAGGQEGLWQARLGARVIRPFASLPLSVRPPTEIHVTVAPSHDRDGRPVQVMLPRDRGGGGGALPVVHSVGPTRVAGAWWTGHDKSRDYFDIELPDGRRWWVFRVNETGRWFWQGEY